MTSGCSMQRSQPMLPLLLVQLLLLLLAARADGWRFLSPNGAADSDAAATVTTVSESTEADKSVYTVQTDAACTFSLVDTGGTTACTSAEVYLNPSTGSVDAVTLHLTKKLDYETQTTYLCKVKCDSPARTAEITIRLNNVFDESPTTTITTVVKGDVTEETDPGTDVTLASAITFTDSEVAAASDVLTCSLSGTGSDLFYPVTTATAGGCTCGLKVKNKIDRDVLTSDIYPNIVVTATDKGGNIATVTVSINILDINDNSPVCPTPLSVSVAENDGPKDLKTVVCTDADKDKNAELVYTAGGSIPAGYSVSAAGVVRLTAAKDYDTLTPNPQLVRVVVRDDSVTTADQLTTTATLTVTITPVNDNTPGITVGSDTATVPESATPGFTLFTPAGTDDDKAGDPDGTLTWSIVSADSTAGTDIKTVTGSFAIDSSTGKVTVGADGLDYESWTAAKIIIKAQDGGTPVKSITHSLTVSVTDVNEMAPVFTPASFVKVDLVENNVENHTVYEINVEDPDASKTAVACEIVSGNTDSVFRFNGTNKHLLELAKTIEPDSATNHPLVFTLGIVCKDNGGTAPFLSSSTNIEVDISTRNDNDPIITAVSACTTGSKCSEATTLAGATVATINVNDNDVGSDGEFDCSIVAPAGGPFSLQGCTAVVLSGSLDYEAASEYVLKVQAKDRGSPSNLRTATTTISVGDVDDNAPYCTTYDYSFTVVENAAVNYAVGVVNCLDADAAGVVYSLVPATVPFKLNPGGSNVEVQVKSALDYESVTDYTFTVRTTDSGTLGRTADAVVRVTVNPHNEQTPSFSDTAISVAENSAVGAVVTRFAAADSDTGGHGIVSYAIQSATNSGNDFFSVSNNGDVTLTKALDYEKTQQYELTITATDGGSLVGTGTLTVNVGDVNDNTPVCNNAQVENTMPENAASGTDSSGTLPTATDADSGTFGTVRYSIASGDTGSYFTINANDGRVRRSTTVGLSYESLTPPYNYYNLTIHAIDETGTGPNTATCLVKLVITDVEEGAPQFTPTVASATAVSETAAPGFVVYTPAFTHVDKWDNPTFTLNPTSSLFSVDSATGKITVAGSLDYETTPQHVLNIVATDKNSQTGTMTLTVPITNVNEYGPICTPGSTTVYIDENDQTSPSFPKDVMSFSCSDGDADTTLAYTVVKADGVAGTGSYTFVANKLRTTAALDYETDATHKDVLEITISDQGPGTANVLTVTVTVSVNPVNEYAPVFTASSLTPSSSDENKAVGSQLGQLLATDTDTGLTHGTIKFALIAGNDKGYFALDENTGWVTSAKMLDREDSATYELTVTATDGPGLSVTATMTISLNDINDHSPAFTQSVYSVNVNENAAVGSTILSFTSLVSDGDATSPNNQVQLALQTAGTPFEFPAGTPMDLKTSGTLNAETTPSYSLTVRATDRKGETPSAATRTTDVMVIVNVQPVNLAAPSFSGTGTVSVAESQAVGSLISIVNATDSDSGLAGTITYAIATGNTGGDFVINPNNGRITLKNALDFDAGTKVYYLGIRATDNAPTPKSSTWTLTVSVTDINDNAPIWSAGNTYSLSVAEDTAGVPKTIYSTIVSDPDSGVNGEIQYSVVSQSGTAPDGSSPLFGIESTSGAIRVLHQPDREFMATYSLMVQACDKATAPLCSQKMFTISIADANDHTPSFGLCPKEISVAEGTLANVLLATLPATDKDADANGQIASYSLVSADDGTSSPAFFTVTGSGGVTTSSSVTATSIDRENKAVYKLILRAEDNGSPSRNTGTCSLDIVVTDKNDNAPVVAGTPIIASVSEAATGGTIFYTMSVTDADEGVNAALLFEISAFTPANNFTINNKGQLSLYSSHRLDRERHAAYNLTVKVRDQGTDPGQRTTTVTVSVNVLDVNDNTPAFSGSSIGRSVAENSAVDATIGSPVTATDPDLGLSASLTYQLAGIIVPTSGGDYFKVDELTGQLRVKVAALDRESRDLYIIRLIAADNGSPTALTGTTTVTITITDVNDNTPTFPTSYVSGVSVDENSAAGTSVVTFTATDADIGVNKELTYALNTTELNGALVDTYFQLNAATGELTVKTPIDRETPHSVLQFYVTAEDKGSPELTGTASVNLYINDVNDITPVFSPTFYNTEMYYQEDRTSVVLTTVKATDGDATNNAVLYNWASSSANFVLNPATGAVTPAALQSTSKDQIYVKYITATDSGSPQRTATTTVRIDAFDMNEVGVCITYNTVYSAFLANLATIEASLEYALRSRSATARCETWKYATSGSGVRACHYCVQDNSTDSVSALAAPKVFVTQTVLLQLWRLDTAGNPAGLLQSANFSANPVTLVEGYSDASTTTTTDTPWYQTPWGIAVLVLASVLAASLAALGIGALVHYFMNRSPSVPIAKAAAPRAPAPRAHPQPVQRQVPNRNLNVYRDKKLFRGTPEFGRGYQRSPGEAQRTGYSPRHSPSPTPVS